MLSFYLLEEITARNIEQFYLKMIKSINSSNTTSSGIIVPALHASAAVSFRTQYYKGGQQCEIHVLPEHR